MEFWGCCFKLTTSLLNVLLNFSNVNITNTLLFFVEKMLKSFAVQLQKILTFFQQKIIVYLII